MPVRQYIPRKSTDEAGLINRLASEWQSPDSLADEPVILEEPDRDGTIRRVSVIWSDWGDLPWEKRGEIIMDAAERVKPLDDVLKIVSALGATPEEADHMGIQWR